MRTIQDLRSLQSMNLESKIVLTKARIREWVEIYGEDNVYVSFSGGKDSTVLLHLVREEYPNIISVFADTGLEFPEIRSFVNSFENVTVVKPKMRFDEVIKKYGYPVISKEVAERLYYARKSIDTLGEQYIEKFYKDNGKYPNIRIEQLYGSDRFSERYMFTKYKPLLFVDFRVSNICCNVMKKSPLKQACKLKYGITAQMAVESGVRTQQWLNNGCNGFDLKQPISNPMSFWMEQDVLQYIKIHNISICSVYGDVIEDGNMLCTTGCNRTGCVYCLYGAHLEKDESRMQRLRKTHPRLYDYCIGGGSYNNDGFWVPDQNGLGMGHVIDTINGIYGNNFIKYK